MVDVGRDVKKCSAGELPESGKAEDNKEIICAAPFFNTIVMNERMSIYKS
jgi:hypothetical protein